MKTFDHWLGLLGGTVIMRAASVTACDLSWVGDGYCDRRNNNENCGGYDGGDCCECTCIDEAYECGIVSFSCIDPAAACVDDDDYVPWYYMYDYYYYTDDDASNPSTSCLPTLAGDGLCDATQNNAECGYDGGDCCDCTCVDAVYECGYGGFDCTDPAAACEDEDDDVSEPRGGDGSCGVAGFGSVGDGQCNSENNNEGCGYDGGDCCECTCVDAAYVCGTTSFSCIDPEAWCVDEEDNGSEECG